MFAMDTSNIYVQSSWEILVYLQEEEEYWKDKKGYMIILQADRQHILYAYSWILMIDAAAAAAAVADIVSAVSSLSSSSSCMLRKIRKQLFEFINYYSL